MRHNPDPENTPDGPAYEGRLLDRSSDEIVDQGPSFDIGTLLSRRGLLTIAGLGATGALLAACAPVTPAAKASSTASQSASTPNPSASATTGALPAGEIPDETAGPYPGDGSNGPDVLTRSGILRSDIRSSIGGGATAEGAPMKLRLRILDTANGDAAFSGVAVYVWHCDNQGGYSLYSSGIENESYLRGVQVADDNGDVTYTSIFPACYSGRWPHIHFEVYPNTTSITDSTKAIATSQVALPEQTCSTVYERSEYSGSANNLSRVSLDSDNVFGDDGGALELATVTGDATSGYDVSLVVRVDTRTTPAAGSAPGGGPSRP